MTRLADEERRAASLRRRREELALPMVPVRDATPMPWNVVPDVASWSPTVSAVGVGPDGSVLRLLVSRERPDLLLVVRDDGSSTVLDGAVPADLVQPLPGGRTLVVAARTRDRTPNAQVWDEAGTLVASAFVGDAVAHVLTTPAGSVWVGYADEGRDEISERRLVRFDDGLRLRWAYPYPSEQPGLPGVFDVDVLNVDGETAHCHAWRDHHLLRADLGGVTDLGPTGLLFTRAMALDGTRGAFVGNGGPGRDVVVPFHVQSDGVRVDAPVARLVLPDGREVQRVSWTSRGADLYCVTERGEGPTFHVTLDDLLGGPRF